MAFQAKKQRQVCYIETGDQESIEKFLREARMDRNNDNFNQREHHAVIWTKRKVHVFDAKLNSSKIYSLPNFSLFGLMNVIMS